jgi:ATP-dependent Lon protease
MIKKTYPILTLREDVVFPTNLVPLSVGRERSVTLLRHLTNHAIDDTIVVLTQKVSKTEKPEAQDLHPVGTLVTIKKIVEITPSSYQVIVQGIDRVLMSDIKEDTRGFLTGEAEILDLKFLHNDIEHALFETLKEQTMTLIQNNPTVPKESALSLAGITKPEDYCYYVAGNLQIPTEEALLILGSEEFLNMCQVLVNLLTRQMQVSKTAENIQATIKEDAEKTQKDYYLRQQLKAIKKELGEEDALEDLVTKVEQAGLPEEGLELCLKQIDRLRGMQTASSEYSVTLNFVETLVSIPWSISSDDNLDLSDAQEVLDNDHHGLDKVKTRLIEFLAVRKLKQDMKGPILCMAGPPGVGKTSMGKSIARALGRKFVRISLGGVHDESEIRGHRRTYVGAMPGRLAKALIKAGTNNPVIMLDEIDKVGRDQRGDPQSALLEVLDPEQNDSFGDHYVEVPLDLSNVLFIATANQLENISGPLRDRMEIIHVPSYTSKEKKAIARKHLLPKQVRVHGIEECNITLDDTNLEYVIEKYTREAGVRGLERRMAELCRSVAVKVAMLPEKEREGLNVECDPEYIANKLGPEQHLKEVAQRTSVPGVATGLAWTAVGGDILFVEASKMPGSGRLKLTGQIGDVMRESCEAAMSFIRANATAFGLTQDLFENTDLHVHFPAGSIPKDGPSAGVTIFTAIVSTLTDINVDKNVAMTGEISLRGSVLPVGGIKEKLTAAHRAGIKKVLIPKQCVKDLVDLADEVKNDLEIIPIERVEDLPRLVLEEPLTPLDPNLDTLEMPESVN